MSSGIFCGNSMGASPGWHMQHGIAGATGSIHLLGPSERRRGTCGFLVDGRRVVACCYRACGGHVTRLSASVCHPAPRLDPEGPRGAQGGSRGTEGRAGRVREDGRY